MDFSRQRQRELNALYLTHASNLEQMHEALHHEVMVLARHQALSAAVIEPLHDYVNDQVSLFRCLRKNDYSLSKALSQLIDTLQWRLNHGVDTLTMATFQDRYLVSPFCFFHKQDRCGRPVLVVQLRHMPSCVECITQDSTSLLDFVIYCLEHARKLTLTRTRERQQAGKPDPLLLDLTVLVDFKDAKSLPTDIKFYQALRAILKHYPGLSGTVCLVNFGWMYQGVWQMCKLLLSRETRHRILFPTDAELHKIVAKEDLLADLGGEDPFEWTLTLDRVFVHQDPPPSTLISACPSTLSLYHDAENVFSSASSSVASTRRSSFSHYCTPTEAFTPDAAGRSFSGVSFQTLAQRLVTLSMSRTTDTAQDRGVIRTGRYPARGHKRQLVQSFVFQMWHILIQHRSAFCWFLAFLILQKGMVLLSGRRTRQNGFLLPSRYGVAVRNGT